MRRHALVAAATALGVVAALVPAALTATSSADPTATASVPTPSIVRLVTGDVARVSTAAGRPSVTVAPAQRSGVTGQFEQWAAGGHSFVFPAEARPFLGGVLDPSLFDVTALAGSEQQGRIPVTLTHQPRATVDVPGLTVTAHTATTARGYLSSAGAAAFRAALVRAWRSVAHPGARAPKSLFGGVTHLAVTGAPARVAPHFPQVTLVIDVLDPAGKPAAGGLVGLINTDDSRKFVNFAFYQNGEARISVPYGHYSAITDVADFNGGSFVDRIMPVGDYTVTQNLQHLTIDARDATAQPSVSTPRPADVMTKSVEFDRESVAGGSLGSSFLFDGSSVVYVTPIPQVQVGSMQWLTGYTEARTPKSGTPYSYDLSFLDDGSIPADQAKSVQPYQLTTVDSRYYNARKSDSQFVRAPIYPFQFFVFSEFLPLQTPVERTEYVYGGSSAIWTASLLASPTQSNPFAGDVDDDFRVYPQGADFTADWLAGPLAPAPPEQTSGDRFYTCPACRTDTKMSVLLAPFTDTTPGHNGSVSVPKNGNATTFALYRGTTKIAGGHNIIGARVSVPAAADTYHLHMTVNRAADHPVLSTSTTTDLVFTSSATDGAPRPDGWFCGIGQATDCSVLTLLKATVPLPTSLSDRLPVGMSAFDLTIAPFHGAGPATVTSATFETKTGSGDFVPAALHKIGNGRYRVKLDNPAASAGQPVTVRVSATDDAGDSITQTTHDAYLVAAGAGERTPGKSTIRMVRSASVAND